MKLLNAVFAAAVAFCTAARAADAAPDGAALRVGTFNIRCITGKDKGARSWGSRKAEVVGLIRRLKCDVIGLQEVTVRQKRELVGALGEYAFVGDFRNSNRRSGEAVPVCYLKSRFECLKSGTFWLSETPDKPGSRSWGTSLPRNCAWAILKDMESGKTFCFANTHPDHKSDSARVHGVKVVAKRLLEVSGGVPIVLVGDHNCMDDERPAVYLRSVFSDAIYVSKSPPRGSWRSFSGWRKADMEFPAVDALKLPSEERTGKAGKRIDYIYVSQKGVSVLGYGTVAAKRKGTDEYYSDHFPVIANIVLQ